jgi:hypothetical protein
MQSVDEIQENKLKKQNQKINPQNVATKDLVRE